MPKKIEISHRTIIFTVLFLVFLWFLYFIRDILLMVFVALLIMAILDPFVSRLAKLKIPRALSILLAYMVAFTIIGLAVATIIPPLVEQTSILVGPIPSFLSGLTSSSQFAQNLLTEVLSFIGQLPSQFASVFLSIFSNIIGVVLVLVLAFYMLLARKKLDEQLGVFFGDKKQKEIRRFIDLLENKLGGWARGQMFLMFLVGFFVYIGLTILKIPFALPLAILAGLLEIVPYVGPILAAIPAVIIALGLSPLMGVSTIALYLLVQQVENYLFVPKVMQKSAGVSPIVTLLALAIGLKIAGLAGVILAVPVVITLQIFLKEYLLAK